MPVVSRALWSFREFAVLSEDLQQETLRSRFEDGKSLNSVVCTQAFFDEQSKSNGEWFDLDAFCITGILVDHDSRQVHVLFDYMASAFGKQIQRARVLPIYGRALLVINGDGTEQFEFVLAKVIYSDEKLWSVCEGEASAEPWRRCV